MDSTDRIENALRAALASVEVSKGPPRLRSALDHAVFPGGARVRPQLCLAVASACGDRAMDMASGFAASVELLHCASLVHDDLPCFDDADFRRGRPSVHKLFGQPLAVLAGDALIVLAFENLARAEERLRRASDTTPWVFPRLVRILARSAGAPHGLVAGQAWESEPRPDLSLYHQAKTASLFCAATMGGALTAGADPDPWHALGTKLGEAYQVADDLGDAVATEDDAGKPSGQDTMLGRPNAVHELGVGGALHRLQGLIQQAVDAIPEVDRAEGLKKLVRLQAKRLVPKALRETAA